jgi:hypothetical protein
VTTIAGKRGQILRIFTKGGTVLRPGCCHTLTRRVRTLVAISHF